MSVVAIVIIAKLAIFVNCGQKQVSVEGNYTKNLGFGRGKLKKTKKKLKKTKKTIPKLKFCG